MTSEIKVYVINASEDKASSVRDWERRGEYEKIISLAEELGTVYSLQGFQDAINDEELFLDNSWIYFSNLTEINEPIQEKDVIRDENGDEVEQ